MFLAVLGRLGPILEQCLSLLSSGLQASAALQRPSAVAIEKASVLADGVLGVLPSVVNILHPAELKQRDKGRSI